MAKLRFVIGDSDEKYTRRLSDYTALHFGEKIEMYSFTEPGFLCTFLQKNWVNGVFVSDNFSGIRSQIPEKTAFAFLSEGSGVEEHGDAPEILKFQNADALIREMISYSSEQVSDQYGGRKSGERAVICLFESPAGGVGTTTAAASCAVYLSHMGKRVLYLNLEPFGDVSAFFSGDGHFDFGDVIYALISRKANLGLKLESVVKQDVSGVFFIEPCRQPMDFMSLNVQGMEEIADTLCEMGNYDSIIMDRNSGLTKLDECLRAYADEIILVSDGSPVADCKVERLYRAAGICDGQEDNGIRRKMRLLYNRCSGEKAGAGEIPVLGCFPRFGGMPQKMIPGQAVGTDVFAKLLR